MKAKINDDGTTTIKMSRGTVLATVMIVASLVIVPMVEHFTTSSDSVAVAIRDLTKVSHENTTAIAFLIDTARRHDQDIRDIRRGGRSP